MLFLFLYHAKASSRYPAARSQPRYPTTDTEKQKLEKMCAAPPQYHVTTSLLPFYPFSKFCFFLSVAVPHAPFRQSLSHSLSLLLLLFVVCLAFSYSPSKRNSRLSLSLVAHKEREILLFLLLQTYRQQPREVSPANTTFG